MNRLSSAAAALLLTVALGCDPPAAPVDAGTDAALADAGADAGAAPLCRPSPVAPDPSRPCSEATRACVEGCPGDNACGDACIDADPNPACRMCANVNIVSCLNRNGCQESWDCYRQCGDEAAPDCSTMPDPQACIGERCFAEDEAYFDCFDDFLETTNCAFRYEDCLPEAP